MFFNFNKKKAVAQHTLITSPTKGKNMRWSFITSARGKMLEVGKRAMKNQYIPKEIGRSCSFFEVIMAKKSSAKTNITPAKKRTSITEASGFQSVSALKDKGRKKVVK